MLDDVDDADDATPSTNLFTGILSLNKFTFNNLLIKPHYILDKYLIFSYTLLEFIYLFIHNLLKKKNGVIID